MAKKHIQPIVKTQSVYNKQIDDLQTKFYTLKNSRWHKATDKERKDFLRSNESKLDYRELSKEDKAFIARSKAGRERAKTAIRFDGKYVNNDFFENPNNPIMFGEIARQKGYKSVKELFDNDRKLYEKAKAMYYDPDGLPMEYHSDIIVNRLDTFGGKIFINGKETEKKSAIFQVDEVDKTIKRKFGNFINEFTVTYKKGYTEMHIDLPDVDFIDEISDAEDLEEYGIYVIGSETLEEHVEKDKKKWEEKGTNPDRYKYAYKINIMEKGRGKKQVVKEKHGHVFARNKDEARSHIYFEFPKCIIVYLKQVPKNG